MEKFLRKLFEREPHLRMALASLSRLGSGSSCRSFQGPWVRWEGPTAMKLETDFPRLTDFIIVVSAKAKTVSSSDAHLRVRSSPLWRGRPGRARKRLEIVEGALIKQNFREIAFQAWSEFWEMHGLFHSAKESFSYWDPESKNVLAVLNKEIERDNPPIVTMDAGPNVHLLVRDSDVEEWRKRLPEMFPGKIILEDRQGVGAEVLKV